VALKLLDRIGDGLQLHYVIYPQRVHFFNQCRQTVVHYKILLILNHLIDQPAVARQHVAHALFLPLLPFLSFFCWVTIPDESETAALGMSPGTLEQRTAEPALLKRRTMHGTARHLTIRAIQSPSSRQIAVPLNFF